MSNKTIFQEKNTRLSANNTDLASILNTINNLPSGGGSVNQHSITSNVSSDALIVVSTAYTGQEVIFVYDLNNMAFYSGDPMVKNSQGTVIPVTDYASFSGDIIVSSFVMPDDDVTITV